MNMKNVPAAMKGILIVVAILLILLVIPVVFLHGAHWASTKLLPWFSILTLITLGLIVLVLLPLAIFRATRLFSGSALLIASHVFGATLWMEGLLLTWDIWGLLAVFIGIFLAGVGVVPIAMLATLLNGMWGPLIELIVLTTMLFGTRMAGGALIENLKRERIRF